MQNTSGHHRWDCPEYTPGGYLPAERCGSFCVIFEYQILKPEDRSTLSEMFQSHKLPDMSVVEEQLRTRMTVILST
jgi:hypothetical protein